MNAYLFTAWTRRQRVRRLGDVDTADSCRSLIIYGGTADEARARYEYFIQLPFENAPPDEIEKIVGAQLVDGLLTESGNIAIDWSKVRKEAEIPESPESEQMEQGYWANCNDLVDPEKLSPDIEALRRGLPEDISSGLNWSAEKQFYYLISALRPWTTEETSTSETDESEQEALADKPEDIETADFIESQQPPTLELADKEAAALVRARNSVVAAWLWRKYAADTSLAKHLMLIDPWCGAIPIEDNPDDPNNAPETPAS